MEASREREIAKSAVAVVREAQDSLLTSLELIRDYGPIAARIDPELGVDAVLSRASRVFDVRPGDLAWHDLQGRASHAGGAPEVEVAALHESSSGQSPGPRAKRLRKGLAVERIARVLSKGGARTEEEIADEIAERFGERLKPGTVYSALWRGRKQGKYVTEDGRWRLATKDETRA